MKKRLISGAIFVAILALAFVLKAFVSNYFFDFVIVAVACISGWEMSALLTKTGKYNNRFLATFFPAFLAIPLLLCIHFQASISLVYTIVIAVATILLFTLITFLCSLVVFKKTRKEIQTRGLVVSVAKFSLIKALNTTIGFVYPSFMMLFFTLINHVGDLTATFPTLTDIGGTISLFVLLLAFLIPIFSDTFAYLVGSLIGGKKLAPKISPNKTISGCIGGVVFCVLLSLVTFLIFNAITPVGTAFETCGISIWKVAIISLIGSLLGQIGDLFESYLKRSAGVKDSGKIMPGHGGLLDRFDSHIFVAPFVFVAFAILFVVI